MPAAPKNDEPKFSRVALETIWAETIQKEQKAAQSKIIGKLSGVALDLSCLCLVVVILCNF